MWFKGDRANIRTNIWKTASCVWTASCHKFSKFKCVSAILWPWSPHSLTAYCACDVSSGGWSLPTQTRLSPLTHLCQISHSGLGCRVINGGSIPDLIPLSAIVNSYWCCDNQIQWGHQGLCVTDQHQLMSHSQLLWHVTSVTSVMCHRVTTWHSRVTRVTMTEFS